MPPFAMPYNQTAAVLNLVGPAVNRSRISLMQVCITPPNPTEASVSHPSTLKRYGIYTALEMVYRAAYYRKLTDRYEKRMADYRDQIRRKYWPRLFNQGVPIVLKPLAAPGAIHEFNAGTWDVNALSTPAGTNALASTQYDVTITWVDNTKYVTAQTKGNGESGPGALVTGFPIAISTVLKIDITALKPPNGTAPINVAMGQGLVVPGNASGWNVYVGTQGGTLYLQNSTPVPIATKTYTLAGAPVLSGFALDSGQYPDQYITMQKMLMRG